MAWVETGMDGENISGRKKGWKCGMKGKFNSDS
jgi:hypothetical protein